MKYVFTRYPHQPRHFKRAFVISDHLGFLLLLLAGTLLVIMLLAIAKGGI